MQHEGCEANSSVPELLRRRVARLIQAAGLQGRHRRRRHVTTVPDLRAAFRPDLIVRDFQPDRTGLDARWCGDITYIPTEEGWLYLATVVEFASRRVVGWATADHLRTELVADALTAACRQRRPTHPVIFHSDRGCQHTSHQSASVAAEFGDYRSAAPVSAGTTRSPSRSSRPSNANCSAPPPGPAGPPPAPRFSIS
ncbi:DDE-type integrase/transposase/recombinase [Streptomyces sp. BE133]|uniref:DDE-type integrase/transposase/recombinase n=1 Tax=Streptomyces sp. BE133 TaxID=3002523 RepID=UPI003FA7D097